MSDPDELTDEQVAELHASLLALREAIAAQLASEHDGTDTVDLGSHIGRVSRIDALQQQQISQATQRRHELRLKQVAVALKTWEDGDYGWCKKCGEAIGYPRLKARPESPCCVSCMAEVERGRQG